MKKSLLLLALTAILFPMDMMAQAYHFTEIDSLKYIYMGEATTDPTKLFIVVDVENNGTITVDGESVGSDYFMPDNALRNNCIAKVKTSNVPTAVELTIDGKTVKVWHKNKLDAFTGFLAEWGTEDTESFQGIEYFRNITSCNITRNNSASKLFSLDVSKNKQLQSLSLSGSNLKIEHLNISNTKITNINNIPTSSRSTLKTLDASNSNLSGTLTIGPLTALEELNIAGTNVARITFREVSDPINNLKKLNVSNCAKLMDGGNLNLTTNTRLEEVIADGTNIKSLTAMECQLHTVSVNNCPKMDGFLAHRNRITNIDFLESVLTNPGFYQIQLNGGTNGTMGPITEPTNAIKYVDSQKLPKTLTKLFLRMNMLDTLNLTNHQLIQEIQVDRNRLWALNLEKLQSLTIASASEPLNFNIGFQEPYQQVEIAKGTARDGSKDSIRLYIPEHTDTLSKSLTEIKEFIVRGNNLTANVALKTDADNKQYFYLPFTGTEDYDLRSIKLKYDYDTKAMIGTTYENIFKDKRKMDVTVTLDPYIMYVNPKTRTPKDARDKNSTDSIDYYSGTLYLDYNAVVPDGVSVWIATAIEDTLLVVNGGLTEAETQLKLRQIGWPKSVIPANTAMYVKSKTAAGLYAFRRAEDRDYIGWINPTGDLDNGYELLYDEVLTPAKSDSLIATAARISNILGESKFGKNILTGTLTEITGVQPRTVLTLSRESGKGTGLIGFWPYKASNGKIPAHRCYITEKDFYDAFGASNGAAIGDAKGASFFFDGRDWGESDVVTEIQSLEQKSVETRHESWYTLQGIRLNSRPTKQGIYVHNGRKEIVK